MAILSPSTRALDLGEKRDTYAEQGTAHLWPIDPDAPTLEAFALDAGGWRLLVTRVGDAQVALPPFKAVTLALADPWS